MTLPATGGGNADYIISRCTKNFEFGEIKLISNIKQYNKLEMNKFNATGII